MSFLFLLKSFLGPEQQEAEYLVRPERAYTQAARAFHHLPGCVVYFDAGREGAPEGDRAPPGDPGDYEGAAPARGASHALRLGGGRGS